MPRAGYSQSSCAGPRAIAAERQRIRVEHTTLPITVAFRVVFPNGRAAPRDAVRGVRLLHEDDESGGPSPPQVREFAKWRKPSRAHGVLVASGAAWGSAGMLANCPPRGDGDGSEASGLSAPPYMNRRPAELPEAARASLDCLSDKVRAHGTARGARGLSLFPTRVRIVSLHTRL